MYEVELKFPIGDPTAVRTRLTALRAQRGAAQTEVDLYFQHPARSFAASDEALRVRQAGGELFVTYKGPKLDAATKTRTEIELRVLPPSHGAADLVRFFEHLGFRPLREVRKERETFQVPWRGRSVVATVDRVEGLGSFIEIELLAEEAELDQARDCLHSLAEELHLEQSERRSYLELLLDRQSHRPEGQAGVEEWTET